MANRSCDSGHGCSSESKLQVVGESVLDTLNATGRSESLLQAVVKVGLITLVAIVPEHLSTICQGIFVPSARASQYHLPGHISIICSVLSAGTHTMGQQLLGDVQKACHGNMRVTVFGYAFNAELCPWQPLASAFSKHPGCESLARADSTTTRADSTTTRRHLLWFGISSGSKPWRGGIDQSSDTHSLQETLSTCPT